VREREREKGRGEGRRYGGAALEEKRRKINGISGQKPK
jgi:hypothetical protein